MIRDENVNLGPRADKKFGKQDLEWTKSSKNGTLKVSEPPSSSLRGDPLDFLVRPAV